MLFDLIATQKGNVLDEILQGTVRLVELDIHLTKFTYVLQRFGPPIQKFYAQTAAPILLRVKFFRPVRSFFAAALPPEYSRVVANFAIANYLRPLMDPPGHVIFLILPYTYLKDKSLFP